MRATVHTSGATPDATQRTPVHEPMGRDRACGVADPSKRVTAIVPVFNEQKGLATVLETLLCCPAINQIVCVNDGSTDDSLHILEQFGDRIVLIDLPSNRGKGYALAQGIRRADGEIVVFFDADLTNLDHDHVHVLLQPVQEGDVRAVLGIPAGDTVFSTVQLVSPGFAEFIGPKLTGQRAYLRRVLLPHLAGMEPTRFGVEIFLNGLFAEEETRVVTLRGLIGLSKQAKHGKAAATKEYAAAASEVTAEIARTGLSRVAGWRGVSHGRS